MAGAQEKVKQVNQNTLDATRLVYEVLFNRAKSDFAITREAVAG